MWKRENKKKGKGRDGKGVVERGKWIGSEAGRVGGSFGEREGGRVGGLEGRWEGSWWWSWTMGPWA